MPIKFRCPHCQQFLGISDSKAGALTDCPTCGRTVRVPQRDGRVAPLPPPELDHGDRSLAQALDTLASLESGPAVVAEMESEPAKPRAEVISSNRGPAVEAIPIPSPDVSTEQAGSSSDARAISELASWPEGTSSLGPETSPAKPIWQRREVIGAVCGAFLFGVLSGRWSAPRPSPSGSPDVPPSPKENVARNAAPVEQAKSVRPSPQVSSKAIEGKITYQAEAGEVRPDAGTRILVLPERHPAASRIAAASFQSGASELDTQLAQASIRLLGGDFAVADREGHYAISLPKAGPYRMIIFSRYQSRAETFPTEKTEEFLKSWFDQPLLLLGRTQVHSQEIQFDGQKILTHNQSFSPME